MPIIHLWDFQESHKERIGEYEFLFAEDEFDVNKLLVLVDFYNRTFTEFLVKDKAIKRAEVAERMNIAHEATIEKQKQRIDALDRKANPHRYRL